MSELKNKVHTLRWTCLDGERHEATVVGGPRPYINFNDPDGCGTVSVEPYELRRILKSLEKMENHDDR